MVIVKGLILLVLTSLIILISLQNADPVPIHLLNGAVELPLATILLGAGFSGVLVGFFLGWAWRRRRRKPADKDRDPSPHSAR